MFLSNYNDEFNYDIQFDTEGGTVASPTTLEGITYTWTTDSSDIISRAHSGNLADSKFFYINLGAERNLPNYNYADYINISKTGYTAVSGAEWKCLSGCTTANKTFNHITKYNATDYCDVLNGDCTIVVGVNWKVNIV